MHAANHELGDTKHRVIDYRFRASTRFPEYFHADLLAPDPGVPGDDGRSVVGPTVSVSVPSSARPGRARRALGRPALPLVGRNRARAADGAPARTAGRPPHLPRAPLVLERRRRAARRPARPRRRRHASARRAPDQSGFPFVSKWGGDPAWFSAPVEQRPLGVVQLDNLLRTTGLDDRPEPGRPVTPPQQLPLAALPEQPQVMVVGYRPQYNRGAEALVRRRRARPGPDLLAVRPPGRLPLPARQHRRLPPLGAGALPLRPADARSGPRASAGPTTGTSASSSAGRSASGRSRSGARPAADAFAEAVGANRPGRGEAPAPRPGDPHGSRLEDGGRHPAGRPRTRTERVRGRLGRRARRRHRHPAQAPRCQSQLARRGRGVGAAPGRPAVVDRSPAGARSCGRSGSAA